MSRSKLAAMMGNALEYYDVMLYGFFAATLSPLFFPFEDPTLSIIASFGTFAASFLMRPLGGIVFGHIGDRIGRKTALSYSILLVALPTFTLGILPPYASIGLAAPVILILCRLMQGFCIGGEYSGASVFIIEHSDKKKAGFAGSMLCASSSIGALIGTILGSACTTSFMPEWGWRIPFILGGAFGIVGYFLRRSLNESPVFEKISHRVLTHPLLEVFKAHTPNLIRTIFISGVALVPFYTASIYMGSLLTHRLQISTSHMMLINTGLMVIQTLLVLVMGYLSDKVGKTRLMSWATIGFMIAGYPLFYLATHDLSFGKVLLAQVILCLLGPAFVAPLTGVLPDFFPPRIRYSAIAFGSTVGAALFGGTAPLILAFLAKWTGNDQFPALYFCICGLIGWVALKTISSNPSPNIEVTLNAMGYTTQHPNLYGKKFITEAFTKGGPVLDIGCAYGNVVIPILKKGVCIIANDLDERHLSILEKRTPKSKRHFLTLLPGCFPGDLNLSTNYLSAALASQVFHFLSPQEIVEALRHVHTFLKPGGRFYFTASTPFSKVTEEFLPTYRKRKESGELWAGFIEDVSLYLPKRNYPIPNSMTFFDKDTVTHLFHQAGFVIEELSYFSEDFSTDFFALDGREMIGAVGRKVTSLP